MKGDRSFPNAPSNKGNAIEQAEYLASLLRASLGTELSQKTVSEINQHLGRVGTGNYDDLVAAIFLECWQEHKNGNRIDDERVRKAADRVRHRLIRSAKRVALVATPETSANASLPPDDELNLVLNEFHTFLRNRSIQDAILFQRYYLDNQMDIKSLAVELQVSPATVYRRLESIRTEFLSLREAKERSNASD